MLQNSKVAYYYSKGEYSLLYMACKCCISIYRVKRRGRHLTIDQAVELLKTEMGLTDDKAKEISSKLDQAGWL